jgi:hypothetical protein
LDLDLDNMGDFEDDVGLSAEDKKHGRSNQVDWFKGEKGRTYRVALVYFHPIQTAVVKAVRKKNPDAKKEDILPVYQKALAKRAEELGKAVDALEPHEMLDTQNVRFKKFEAHYKQGIGFVKSRLGMDGSDADTVWKSLGDPRSYFTTVLLIYPTNKDGELNKESVANGWFVIPWRFSTRVFSDLHAKSSSLRENNLSIATQDLLLKCTNTDFQNFDINPAGPAFWAKNAKFASAVLTKAYALYEKIDPFRELSTADLKIKLGLGGGSSGSEESVTDDDFNALINQV